MEAEDRETTDSGSLSGNPETDSPSSGGDYFGRSDGAAAGLLNMNVMSTEMNAAAGGNAPAVSVVGGGGGGGGVVGGGSGSGHGRGNGDSSAGMKRRGRPRKYDAEGNLNPAYLRKSAAFSAGFSPSTASPPYEVSSGKKRGRGRPAGSGNWQLLSSLGELFVNTAGGDFTPHVVTVETGEDVAGKILSFAFAHKTHRGICVLSANGPVSSVTLRQSGSCGGLLTYEGRFEILTLTGSYTVSDSGGGMKSRTGGLSVSLASPDGRVIGGGVAGMLTAASPIQIVVGSFVPDGFKMQKQRKAASISPATGSVPAKDVTAAIPLSQAPPEIPSVVSPLLGKNHHGDAHYEKDALHSSAAEWNGSGPPASVFRRASPDINIPTMPMED